MDPAGMMRLRQNNDELLDYIRGLDNWEEEMREKDETLSKNRSILKENLPPVRSSTKKSQKQKKRKKATVDGSKSGNRIHSYDYKAWDNFDVDKACEQVDYDVQSSSESEGEGEGEGGSGGEGQSDDDEMTRHRAMAIAEKEKGNVLYKKGKYEDAVECYSRGILLDPLSAALPANRALALMKLERYAAVEDDCNIALALDEEYVKAYLRRGVARRHLGKYSEAVEDFEQVLKLEPGNKQGAAELKIAQKMKEDCERKRLIAEGHVFPVKRPKHLRSIKPLRRIMIDDISGQVEDINTSQIITNTNTEDSRTTEQTDITRQSSMSVVHDSEQALLRQCSNETDRNHSTTVSHTSDELLVETGSIPPENDDSCISELPTLPVTSFEFQSHWKKIRSNHPLLVNYFKRLPPTSYPVLLKQSLETNVFSDIISIIKDECKTRERNLPLSTTSTSLPPLLSLSNSITCIEWLTWLTKVSRFSVAVMFLSKTDKNNLQSVFVDIMDVCSSDSDKNNLKKLSTKFGIKL